MRALSERVDKALPGENGEGSKTAVGTSPMRSARSESVPCHRRIGRQFCWLPMGHKGACRPGINR